ncbi:MAG: diguanylate cyclase [Pseudomarimonas sp.]
MRSCYFEPMIRRALLAERLAHCCRGLLVGLILLSGLAHAAESGLPPAGSVVPRHAQELRALIEPEKVLAELPAEIAAARASGDQTQLALLLLAEANACRVVADWLCQRRASADAATAGRAAERPLLIARGKILESRAVIGLQDYTRAEQLLAEAQTQLDLEPSTELSADVLLGFSSLSFALGKHQLAADYARQGLQLLGTRDGAGLQARLHRNFARSIAQLGDTAAAQVALEAGILAAQRVDDPKLVAELHLESARLANKVGDVAAQRRHSSEVLALADRLKNSQLFGQAHEALGLSAIQAGDFAAARSEFSAAVVSFKGLGLSRDELRATQRLLRLLLDQRASAEVMGPLLRRSFDLGEEVAQRDRTQAADDFETRLQYARQQLDIMRLESDARLAQERNRLLDAESRLSRWVTGLSVITLLVFAVLLVLQLRAKRRLERVLGKLRRSESRATELLRLSKGMVLLHDLDGCIDLLNPAAAQALLVPADTRSLGNLRDHIAPLDTEVLSRYLSTLRDSGEASEVLQITPRGGETRLIRIDGRVAPNSEERPYVIGNAADITIETREAEALRKQTLHDPLTGCYNRRYLDTFAATAANDAHWAVINIDLDGFKQINDRFGHEHGDVVLREVATFIGKRLREHDALVRVGGDEFLILLANVTTATLQSLVARLQADMETAPCRFSLGSAEREGDEELQQTIARADTQMYARRRQVRGGAVPLG